MSRIGIDCTAGVRQGAGIGRYVRGLVRALVALDAEDDLILMAATGGLATGMRRFDIDAAKTGVTWRSVPFSDRLLALLWQRFRVPVPVQWFTGPVDLYHSTDFALPPVRRTPSVLTVHDLSFMRHPECFSPELLRYLMSAVPRSVGRADLVLADSESTRNDLVEMLGVHEDGVAVVYPGLEPAFRRERQDDDGDALRRYGIAWPYILGLGTLQPRKNFCRLIRAFEHVTTMRDTVHHLVIGGGGGWLGDDIVRAATESPVADRIHLIGYVRDTDLPALYRGAAVFAFPSLYEGFGLPVLEAMGCGTPVVTANTSSLPEVAGEAAVAVSPTDVDELAGALWRLLEDEALRCQCRMRGIEQVRHFSWERAAKTLFGHYHSII